MFEGFRETRSPLTPDWAPGHPSTAQGTPRRLLLVYVSPCNPSSRCADCSFTDCRETDDDFLNPTDSVRGGFPLIKRLVEVGLTTDTLEAVDISLNLIEKYSDTFKLATTADDVLEAVKEGKVASLLGVEGGHSLGNSLSGQRSCSRGG